MATKMKKIFIGDHLFCWNCYFHEEKVYGKMENVNQFLLIAIVLDLRYNLDYAIFIRIMKFPVTWPRVWKTKRFYLVTISYMQDVKVSYWRSQVFLDVDSSSKFSSTEEILLVCFLLFFSGSRENEQKKIWLRWKMMQRDTCWSNYKSIKLRCSFCILPWFLVQFLYQKSFTTFFLVDILVLWVNNSRLYHQTFLPLHIYLLLTFNSSY